jgi:site-specific DNA recombinase
LHNHELVDAILEYEGAGSSKREGLKRAFAKIKKNEVDALLYLKLDRLCRSLRDLMEVLDLFDKYGKALVSVQGSLDTKSPGGRHVLSVLGAVAEWELASTRDRTNRLLA